MSESEQNKAAVRNCFEEASRGNFDAIPGTNSLHDRLSSEGWQSCASCHFRGLTDGVVWQFAAGPRKSVSLNSTFNPHNRDQQRVLNYSAIFDEVEDFEINIRNVSGPGPLAGAGIAGARARLAQQVVADRRARRQAPAPGLYLVLVAPAPLGSDRRPLCGPSAHTPEVQRAGAGPAAAVRLAQVTAGSRQRTSRPHAGQCSRSMTPAQHAFQRHCRQHYSWHPIIFAPVLAPILPTCR